MSENCSHNCSSCGETCASRTMESFRVPLNPQSSVKKVIGVVSGKGGVGKSLVTSLMACKMRARNNRVGILDADITGPSIPKAFGIHGMVGVTADQLMLPRTTSTGIEILSSNLILEHETDPVIWRGPVVGGGYLVVKVRGKLTRCVGNEKLEIIFLCILYRNFPYYHFRSPDIFHIFFHLSPLRHR